MVDAEGFDDPVGKWSQILGLLEAAPDDWQVGRLAAGPLEDLIRRQGPAVIGLIEAEAPWTTMPVPPGGERPFWELVEEVIEAEAPLIRMPEPPFPDTNRFEITTPSELFA